MGLFYTRKGDGGVSHVGKIKIKKTNHFAVTLGDLDELNSMLGVIKSMKVPGKLRTTLHEVQETLFIIQANIAYAMLKSKDAPPRFDPEKTVRLEKQIDIFEKKLKPAKKFVISGTTHVSAWLDLARAKSRSVERSVLGAVRLSRRNINPDIFPYLNRLSSLLFALARWESRNKKESYPKYK